MPARLHRFSVLRRSQGEICEALNHEQAHAWLSTGDQAFTAAGAQHHGLSFSARQTFRSFDLRSDSFGRWPFPPLINALESVHSGHAVKERLRKPRLMSQSKREQVVSHLRYIRQELREMHQGVMEDGLLPEAGEVRGVMAQMEALLELLEGKSSRKAKAESD